MWRDGLWDRHWGKEVLVSHLISAPLSMFAHHHPLSGHVRQATHRATGRKVAVKILPALDFDQVITKDILLDAIEAQKEVILLKVMGAFGIKGVVGLDMVKQEGDWK
jgi:hypothetical protein